MVEYLREGINLNRLTDKIIIAVSGVILSLIFSTDIIYIVPAFLVAVITSSISQYAERKLFFYAAHVCFAILAIIFPAFWFFLPVSLYEVVYSENKYFRYILFCIPLISFTENSLIICFSIIAVSITAICLSYRSSELEKLKNTLTLLRDSSAENRQLLLERNKFLRESKDNEINIAVMTERNRIAREIHDNVGHMLSRTILQMGAVKVINQDENIKPHLEEISRSLDGAMTSMRESVHNLHDDSLMLGKTISDLIKPLEENMMVKLDVDISEKASKDIKICIIGIVREAVSNIIRHSNGDSVVIVIREHPAFYQASIEDNGKNSGIVNTGGMGLENMKVRAEKAGGIFKYYTEENKFRIFVSIPKEK